MSFLSFYILTIILIVRFTDSVDIDVNQNFELFAETTERLRTLQRMKRNVKVCTENKKSSDSVDEAKLFENIEEPYESSTLKIITVPKEEDNSLKDIKKVLEKILVKLNTMDVASKKVERKSFSTTMSVPLISTETVQFNFDNPIMDLKMKKRNELNTLRKLRWGQWTSWSACSVTCGKGRQIRWRHCLEDCEEAETEMEEKACQLPACGPGKLFGIRL